MIELWSSDYTAPAGQNDIGNVTQFRVGLTRYLKGHNAAIKAGYEMTSSDSNIVGSGTNADDKTDAFVLGTYVTY